VSAAMLAVATRAIGPKSLLLLVWRAVVTTGARFIRDGVHASIAGPQPGRRLKRLRVANRAILIEHRVGRGQRPGLVQELVPRPEAHRPDRRRQHEKGGDRDPELGPTERARPIV